MRERKKIKKLEVKIHSTDAEYATAATGVQNKSKEVSLLADFQRRLLRKSLEFLNILDHVLFLPSSFFISLTQFYQEPLNLTHIKLHCIIDIRILDS